MQVLQDPHWVTYSGVLFGDLNIFVSVEHREIGFQSVNADVLLNLIDCYLLALLLLLLFEEDE